MRFCSLSFLLEEMLRVERKFDHSRSKGFQELVSREKPGPVLHEPDGQDDWACYTVDDCFDSLVVRQLVAFARLFIVVAVPCDAGAHSGSCKYVDCDLLHHVEETIGIGNPTISFFVDLAKQAFGLFDALIEDSL